MRSPQQNSFLARNSLALSILVFVGAGLLLPWVGEGPISLGRVLRHESPDYDILIQLRISRTLLALVAGGALSLAGALFQAMLRDALATPYTLGISAGASLGAGGGHRSWLANHPWHSCDMDRRTGRSIRRACIGNRKRATQRQISAFSLLLTGIAINSVCAAFIIILAVSLGCRAPSRLRVG